jgi:N-acyl-D-amino-acid deacylase
MEHDFSVVIRGGTIVDGSGGEPFKGDVAIKNGIIQQVGNVTGTGQQEITADGMLVTPGFVDIHTHYDGQVSWENRLSPSTDHGVTTVVMGNCGVGFAPCKTEDRDRLVNLMEGVEDIPEIVMTTGIPWSWQTFEDYLDFLSAREFDADCAAYLPHAALRVFVMGERGASGEPSTAQDRQRMTELVTEALNAGAIGVSTSRTLFHRFANGNLAPHVQSGRDELLAMAEGMRNAGKGIFELAAGLANLQLNNVASESTDTSTSDVIREEVDLYRDIAEVSGRTVTFTLTEFIEAPGLCRDVLDLVAKTNKDGISIRAQTIPRPVGVLSGLALSLHPFKLHPSYREIEDLPLVDRVAKMRQPEVRARILAEEPDPNFPNSIVRFLVARSVGSYVFGNDCNYEPGPELNVAVVAAKRGVPVLEAIYDILLEDDGKSILFLPLNNYSGGNLDGVYNMITDRNCLIGLGDGGAHYGFICDASVPTSVLSYWTRDRKGPRLTVPYAVHVLTRRNALAVGLDDRGLIAPGLKADVNVIDYANLKLHSPKVVHNLPAGGHRMVQHATGYVATIVSGEVTYRHGQMTGALPGRLVRVGNLPPQERRAVA